MAETLMMTPGGERLVYRPHTASSSPLRAWSAADQLALEHVGTNELGRLLIVNDEFGALTVGLDHVKPVVWTDSALSRRAIEANLAANDLDPQQIDHIVPGDERPHGSFDTVIVRVPKTHALLEYQLQTIRGLTTNATVVIGAGMARHIQRSTLEVFERWVGPTTTSQAKRKARLIFAEHDAELSPLALDTPVSFTSDPGIEIKQRPGTFSADHVDVGSALLLEVLRGEPAPPADAMVADLGCGNGVLAASIARDWHSTRFLLLDVSDLAVAAARETWQHNQLGDRAELRANDGFEGVADASIDVVISNPPFHQGHALDPDLTDRLLADVARVLTATGTAYVVAQRHLNLHTRMRRWFNRVEVRSGHPSHVVLVASNRNSEHHQR